MDLQESSVSVLPPLSSAGLDRPQSRAAFETACTLMPGGVNSPVRAFRSVGGTPLFFKKAEGPYVWDVDGYCYIDYVGSWGPAILGHAHPSVLQKVQAVMADGLSFGAPTLHENRLAQCVIDRVPSVEKVRFVSSGTEAVMSAVRLARAATGRPSIIKFEGCYHGHADFLLVKAGSGASTLGIPDSAGVTAQTAANTLTATYNDLASVERWFAQCGEEIAAVLVEPVAGNMGCIPPEPGFLEGLRAITQRYGSLLIFDEVMTGFRVAAGGAQQLYSVLPDITALGKVIGGGLPVGAYGASQSLMANVAPEGPMYQAGTLSGNPLGMVAGLETLEQLASPGAYDRLLDATETLATGLRERCKRYALAATVTHVCGMFSLFFNPGPVCCYADVLRSDREQFNRFFWGMLQEGIYLAPSPFEAGFVSLAHTPEMIEQTLQAAERVLARLAGE
ncbi:MAG: glutamate-1-semialdehyde 2,1-aminomutase [Candidatus Melainabacteria bacterium]|nr:glutamate-1-semialdehyde 2,1-aminomutase [Candidatus Melainabacteria bacterium]